MKMHRIVVYVLDFEGYGAGDAAVVIGNAIDHALIWDKDTKTAEIGPWSDDHLINQGVHPEQYFIFPGETEEQRSYRQHCVDYGLPA